MKINAKQQSGVFCPRQTSILGSQCQVLLRKEPDYFYVREEQYIISKNKRINVSWDIITDFGE